ncbi:MAG: ribosome maturation factor RimM [Nitrospiraceae bacterium]|nr:ribosome maturation factor RimM [Nitrospiraceae bacterium]
MLITIGKVQKPHGVKGEVKVEPLTDHLDRFRKLRRVFLTASDEKTQECAVKAVRYLDSIPLLQLAGYDSPERARELNGRLVQIPEEEAVPLPEGQYYWFELIGMEVLSEAGEKLGRIVDIFQTGSNDVYVMQSGKREIYLPATKEIVKQVDRQAKRMVIHVMEGLLD